MCVCGSTRACGKIFLRFHCLNTNRIFATDREKRCRHRTRLRDDNLLTTTTTTWIEREEERSTNEREPFSRMMFALLDEYRRCIYQLVRRHRKTREHSREKFAMTNSEMCCLPTGATLLQSIVPLISLSFPILQLPAVVLVIRTDVSVDFLA